MTTTTIAMELWKDIEGFEGRYQISTFGRVKSMRNRAYKTERILKPIKHGTGYLIIGLYDGTRSQPISHRIHILVARAFIPIPLSEQELHVCHNDGSKTNNTVENLRWDSVENNQRDRLKHGTDSRGEKCKTSKLTNQQVSEIKERLKSGEKGIDIANELGVAKSTISKIKKEKNWSWL